MLHYKTIANIPDGKWVVMIHGAGGNIEVWFKQVADFARHFNLVLVDLAGHGSSQTKDVFTTSFDFDLAADQVIEVVDHLKIRRAHFMGLSLGSIIVHAIAEHYPERIDSMVLAGAVTHLSLKTRLTFEFVDMFKRLIPFSIVKVLLANAIIPQQKYGESKGTFLRSAQKLTYEGFMQWMRLVASVDSYMDRLIGAQVTTPTLYVMGEDDTLCLPKVKEVVAHSGENVRLEIVPNAGHVCNIDNKQYFNRVSLDFLGKY